MNSSKQVLCLHIIFSLLHLAHNDFIGIIASSILTFLHFILVSIVEIIYYFQGIQEQFHIGHCGWNVSLLHPTCKDFIGIIPSSIPAFLYFILVSITEIIFHFHGSHDQFHIGYFVWKVSLLHLARKDLIGIIPSSIQAFLHFILTPLQKLFFIFKVFMNSSTKDIVFGMYPSSTRLIEIS